MSHAQLTVNLRMVSQGQAAAGQLLGGQELHQACCSPSSTAKSSVVDDSCKQQPLPAESSSPGGANTHEAGVAIVQLEPAPVWTIPTAASWNEIQAIAHRVLVTLVMAEQRGAPEAA